MCYVYVCVCVCVCMCLCVFESTSSVDQTYVLSQTCLDLLTIYILLSPSFPVPFEKWTSQWGDTAQVSIFPQETSVYISKWVQKNPVWTANLSSVVKSALIWPPSPLRGFYRGVCSGYAQRSCHGFLSWESPVVERVHVNDLLCFNDDGRLRLLFEAALALQRHAQLIHHGTAEWSLQKRKDRKVIAGTMLVAKA